MTTSGSLDFNQNRDSIINRAFRILGILAQGETASAEMVSDAAIALNAMIKAWEADAIHLWKYKEGRLFFVEGQAKYSLGSTGNNAASTHIKTELSTAAVATDLTIEVDSIVGISDGDNIGIVLDDNTIQWTTVNGTPAGTTITLSAAIIGDAAVDNNVYIYTNIIERPLRIKNVRRRTSDDNDVPISIIAREEYFDLPNKSITGNPTQIYYNPTLGNGTIYIWPTPSTVSEALDFTFESSIEDFDSIVNTPDFPQEWLAALAFNLASDILTEYGIVDPATISRIDTKAAYYLDKVLTWDVEPNSIFIQPDDMKYYGY